MFSFHEYSLSNYTFWVPGTMLNAEASGLSKKKMLILFKSHSQKEETDTYNNYNKI